MSKEEIARKLHECEFTIQIKTKELEDLQSRFEKHMNANQKTEASLYERISDLQNESEMLKKLRAEDQELLKQERANVQDKVNDIKDLQHKIAQHKATIDDYK